MAKLELPEGFKPNPGHLPEEAVGKRVRVILRDGHEPVYADANTQAVPTGWAADGRGGCRWTIGRTPSPFDIVGYLVIGG